jgi:hypothetical protein
MICLIIAALGGFLLVVSNEIYLIIVAFFLITFGMFPATSADLIMLNEISSKFLF